MKPLTHCPYCSEPLIKKTIPEHLNPLKYEYCSKRCEVDYFQYYANSYEDTELQYISMDTPDNKFNYYYYLDRAPYPAKTIYAYSTLELKKNGTAMPFIKLYDFDLTMDRESLEKFQEKLSIYILFS